MRIEIDIPDEFILHHLYCPREDRSDDPKLGPSWGRGETRFTAYVVTRKPQSYLGANGTAATASEAVALACANLTRMLAARDGVSDLDLDLSGIL